MDMTFAVEIAKIAADAYRYKALLSFIESVVLVPVFVVGFCGMLSYVIYKALRA